MISVSTPADVLEHVSCPLCGGTDYGVIHEARYEDEKDVDLVQKFRASGDELLIDRLVQCTACELQYISPRLRGDLIMSSYADGEDEVYVSQVAARVRTFDASLAQIEKLTGGTGRLLDIGTAAGAFLAAAQARGWDAEGCEPNRWLANWGATRYGVKIRPGGVFEQDYAPASFDVVTLWDVLEHTTDPKAMLERCLLLLRPRGLLVVNYPDIGSWIARALGRRWLFLTSVHLHYFTRRTIVRILEATGFTVATIRPHVQRLELDYILSRGSVLHAGLSDVSRRLVTRLGLSRKQVPYWLGQTFVGARKMGAVLFPLPLAIAEIIDLVVLL
ncbi:MAG TPA: methyltransferase domain-containing protein [Vicinamibacterales bacterium]|nr:methyltransferase domain-containing protein [Vicinamibacterales bacterium]